MRALECSAAQSFGCGATVRPYHLVLFGANPWPTTRDRTIIRLGKGMTGASLRNATGRMLPIFADVIVALLVDIAEGAEIAT